MEKQTVTATFPGIGEVEISKERAAQILRLQKMIRERKEQEEVYGVAMTGLKNMEFSKWLSNSGIAMNNKSPEERTKITSDWMKNCR